MTFKGFKDSKRLLDLSQYFEKIEGKKISALLPKSREKSFDSAIIIPKKIRFCIERNDKKCVKSVIINSMKTKNFNLNLMY